MEPKNEKTGKVAPPRKGQIFIQEGKWRLRFKQQVGNSFVFDALMLGDDEGFTAEQDADMFLQFITSQITKAV